MGAAATATSWVGRIRGSASNATVSTIILMACTNPESSIFCIGPLSAFSGVPPNPMT